MIDIDHDPYDSDCASCARALKDYRELESVTDDLTLLVRRLAHALRKAAPGNDLAAKALDYLKRHGMEGSILRAESTTPALDKVLEYIEASGPLKGKP